jgi:TrmH family RNA methyltransferase
MITSVHNPKLQRIRALLVRKEERLQQQAFVVEGVRLVEEAYLHGWLPELALVSPGLSERGKHLAEGFSAHQVEVEEVPDHLMASIAGTEAPQGILAVLPMRSLPLPVQPGFLLVCDNLRDPGNLGTLLRTALAAGVEGVLLTPGTADAFAPKVVRSGMGAHFRLPVMNMTWPQINALCHPAAGPRINLFIAEAEQGSPCWQLDLKVPLAMVVGGEAEGVSPEGLACADGLVTIPMPGKSESLNAAVAASILMFEVVRQRQK